MRLSRHTTLSHARMLPWGAVVLCALLVWPSIGWEGGPPAEAAQSTSSVGLLALGQGDFAAAAQPGRYQYVVLNAWDYPDIPILKRANPDIRVLVYKDMSSTRRSACQGGQDQAWLPSGVGYCWAAQNRPGWFVADQNGDRIEWRGYPGHWWMDVGNPDYQQQWLANVLPELQAKGWDGVYVDNAIIDPSYYLHAGQTIPKYPNQPAYQAATDSFLAAVAPQVRAVGMLVIPNLGGGFDPAVYGRWAGYASGVNREWWGRYATSGRPLLGWDWNRMMNEFAAVAAEGKIFLAISYGSRDDTSFERYARASFLLGWDGEGALLYRTSQGTDPWSPDWTIDIGTPTGARYRVGAAWRRDFTGGTVVVDPSTKTVTVKLGAQYRTQDGKVITTITLPSGTGAVLRAVS